MTAARYHTKALRVKPTANKGSQDDLAYPSSHFNLSVIADSGPRILLSLFIGEKPFSFHLGG